MPEDFADYREQHLAREFHLACRGFERELVEARSPERLASWQSTKAPAPMPEILNASLALDLKGVERLKGYQEIIKPNLPWADEHFVRERVSGQPKNPGTTWRTWPYAASAARHRVSGNEDEDPPFDHSYAERYWPKFAGQTKGGLIGPSLQAETDHSVFPLRGIRSEYGDLTNLVDLLEKDPATRQAYLPVWFPEDLYGASVEGRRVPCTLGYHFIVRNRRMHCFYPMRSCDYIRHFRDDVYLTIRLLLFVLQALRFRETKDGTDFWNSVVPGEFRMHMTSLHCFEPDQKMLEAKLQREEEQGPWAFER